MEPVNQRGNSTLGMVLMLLLLGSLTLHAARTQLAQGMVLVADEQQHHRDFWQAQAALQWGLTQNWPAGLGWQCQSWAPEQWHSCLLRMEEGHAVLSGQGEGRELRLWQWVASQGHALQPQRHGWLDYCPLGQPENCQPHPAAAGL